MVRLFFLFVMFWLVAGCATSPSDVVTIHCERKKRCCQSDFQQCVASMEGRIQRTMPATLQLYVDMDHMACEPNVKRLRLWNMLQWHQPPLTMPATCSNHNDCPYVMDSHYIKTAHWMCSCPLKDRVKGACAVKVCTAPAKVGQRCAASPLPILCDSAGWCSIGEGDATGVCVARKELGEDCRRSLECKETPEYIGFCQRRSDSVWGKCVKAQIACGA